MVGQSKGFSLSVGRGGAGVLLILAASTIVWRKMSAQGPTEGLQTKCIYDTALSSWHPAVDRDHSAYIDVHARRVEVCPGH